MNIQQMHIEVDLSTQKIASNVKRKFQPDEIDWLLNKQIGRFVENQITPNPQQGEAGFQADGINLDALRTLAVYDRRIQPYKINSIDQVVLAELPGDYAHLIQYNAQTVRDCEAGYKVANTYTQTIEYVYALKVPKSEKSAAPYYTNNVLTVNGTIVVPASKFPTSLPAREMNFVIQDILKNELLHNLFNYRVYWERYQELYTPECFYFVSSTPIAGISLLIDSTLHIAPQVTRTLLIANAVTDGNFVVGRPIRASAIGQFMQSAFAKTRWKSPISQIQGNSLKVYHDNKFIVNNLYVDYIRKPRLVSLSLGYSCDLPEEYHQKICDMTEEYIKHATGDPNYQWKLQDNQIRG